MKTVMPSANVAHVWAAQTQETARNGSNSIFFRGAILYSWGTHWPIAVFTPWKDEAGRVLVFFHDDTRSNSTSRHTYYARRALNGHPVRVINVRDLAPRDAESLARGETDTLAHMLEVIAERADAVFTDTLKRRDPYRIMCAFEHINGMRADADALVSLVPAKDRRAAAQRLAAWPNVPAQTRDDNGQPLESLRDSLKDARDAYKRDKAARTYRDTLRSARHAWRCANNRHGGTALDDVQRLEHAENAVDLFATAARHAKVAGLDMPGNIPNAATLARLVARLRVPVAILRGYRDLDALRKQSRLHRECYASAARARRKGDTRMSDIYARTFVDGGRYANKSLLGAERLRLSCNRIRFRNEDVVTIAGLVKHESVSQEAAAILRALDENARDFLAFDDSRGARVRAWRNMRDVLNAAERARLAAVDADNTGRAVDLRVAIGNAESYAAERAEWLAAHPSHAGALPPAADAETLERWRASMGAGYVRDSLASAETAAGDTARMITEARTAADASHVVTASRVISDARARLGTLRHHVNAAQSRLATDEVTEAARAILAPQVDAMAERFARLDGDFIIAGSHVETVRADFIARAAAAGDSENVAAWRAGDNSAHVNGVAFRLDRGEVVSTLGARVSEAAARRLWALIRACVARGESRSWEYREGPHVGPFTVQRVGADGSAVVGCHHISASEARTFARIMQWPPFGAPTPGDALPDDLDAAA